MQRYFEALIDTDSGAALTGYYARAIDPVSLATIPLFADPFGTPVAENSGYTDMAMIGESGNLGFFCRDGFFHIDIYREDAVTLVRRYRYQGQDVAYTSGNYTPALTGGTTPGVATGTFRGEATLTGNIASVTISATWTAHTGTGHATFSLPTSIGGIGIVSDPSAPLVIPGTVHALGFVAPANTVPGCVVDPSNNRVRLWNYSIGDGATPLSRSALLLPPAGTVYISARYPVIRT